MRRYRNRRSRDTVSFLHNKNVVPYASNGERRHVLSTDRCSAGAKSKRTIQNNTIKKRSANLYAGHTVRARAPVQKQRETSARTKITRFGP